MAHLSLGRRPLVWPLSRAQFVAAPLTQLTPIALAGWLAMDWRTGNKGALLAREHSPAESGPLVAAALRAAAATKVREPVEAIQIERVRGRAGGASTKRAELVGRANGRPAGRPTGCDYNSFFNPIGRPNWGQIVARARPGSLAPVRRPIRRPRRT